MATSYVFLDTSVLMQFRRPDEVPWLEILQCEFAVLLLCAQVVSELDIHKTSPDARKQKRARATIQWLKEKRTDSAVRVGVTLRFIVVEPTAFHTHGLDGTVPDDRILATLLEFAATMTESDVRLCSADLGITLKAHHRSIPVLELPEAYELPPPDNSRERQLEQEIARLKNDRREPKLKVTSEQGTDQIKVEPPAVKEWTEDDIAAELATERELARADEDTKKHLMASSDDDFGEDSPSEVEGLIEAHLRRLRTHIEHANALASANLRTFPIVLRLENKGTAPASKINVRFYVPDWVSLKGDVTLGEPLARPVWNLKEELVRSFESTFVKASRDWSTAVAFAGLPVAQIDGFFEEDSSWYSLRLQHGNATLIEFYAVIDSDHQVTGFQIGFEVHADECPGPIAGTIHVHPSAP